MFLGKIYYYGDNVQQDIDKAIHYLTISTKLGHSEAQTILGEIYFSNQFVPRDIKKAIYYFKESSNINDSIAKNYLGIIYKNGFGVSKNILQAIEYLDEAIRQKNENFAFYNLARIYYFGIDVDKKIVKAIELLEISSNSKFLPATIFLFFIYKFGDEKIKNFEKEKDYKLRLYNCDLNEKDKNKLFLLSFNERIFEFFKKFDLAPYNEKFYINHFFHFIQNGKFCKQSQNIQSKNKSQKDINNYFYEGFGRNF
ncbi:hypothetical protein M9Y10_033292 [Tritrichomonas musculus]|uniref:Uncharacterized protein n=1 Tax=Tritrichomonas musculus TaxID=1915356 RepID=A0ABR2KCU5_9EUKA